MSLSKECQEYHLTPRGWVEGTFHRDFGGLDEVDVPPDRVLTIGCYDELPHVRAKPYSYDAVLWKSEDKELIGRLKKQYGERPDWFGYKEKS